MSADSRLRVRTLLAPLPLGAVALVALAIAGADPTDPRFEAAIGYLLYGLLLLGVLRACRHAGLPLGAMIGSAPRDAHAWALVAVAVPLLSIMAASMPAVVSALAWVAPEHLQRILRETEDMGTTNGILTAVAVAPVVEELVFRGVLLRAFAARWGLRAGIVTSAVAFAVLHLDVIGALAFGVVMALLYMRTRTLLVPMACHMVYNGLIVLLEPWMQDDAPFNLAEARDAWWIGILGLVGAAAILFALVRRLRPEKGWDLPEVVEAR